MLVKVRVIPDSRREKVDKTSSGLIVTVREEAQGNQANDRVRAIVAREHRVPLSAVRLMKGHRSPSKIFAIDTEKGTMHS